MVFSCALVVVLSCVVVLGEVDLCAVVNVRVVDLGEVGAQVACFNEDCVTDGSVVGFVIDSVGFIVLRQLDLVVLGLGVCVGIKIGFGVEGYVYVQRDFSIVYLGLTQLASVTDSCVFISCTVVTRLRLVHFPQVFCVCLCRVCRRRFFVVLNL